MVGNSVASREGGVPSPPSMATGNLHMPSVLGAYSAFVLGTALLLVVVSLGG